MQTMYAMNCCVRHTTLLFESYSADYNFVCLFHPLDQERHHHLQGGGGREGH